MMTINENDKPYFDRTFDVRYHELDRRGEATPMTFLNYLQECALSHSESVGCGPDYLKAHGTAWVVNRWNLMIYSYPRWKEQVHVRTWATGFQHFYGYRQFRITDGEGKTLGCADSVWIYMNMEKKRPVRITEEVVQKYGVLPEKVLDASTERLEAPEELPVKKELPVLFTDIDTNGHVNNVRYLGWMLEAVPEGLHSVFSVSEFEIVYKKEADASRPVLVCCEILPDVVQENAGPSVPEPECSADECRLIHSVRQLDADTGKTVEISIARTIWKPRNCLAVL